jgi:hypothetical protein
VHMSWLYQGNDRGVKNGQTVNRSGCGFECMGCLYLGQDRGMRIWAVHI